MSERANDRVRKRDSVLAALEYVETLNLPRSLSSIILFLYVCENEGLIVSELAEAAGVKVAKAARLVKILTGEVPDVDLPEGVRLLERRGTPIDRRVKFIYLTEEGRVVRDQLDAIIAHAAPIRVPGAPSAGNGEHHTALFRKLGPDALEQ